jgi:hypothetical protein
MCGVQRKREIRPPGWRNPARAGKTDGPPPRHPPRTHLVARLKDVAHGLGELFAQLRALLVGHHGHRVGDQCALGLVKEQRHAQQVAIEIDNANAICEGTRHDRHTARQQTWARYNREKQQYKYDFRIIQRIPNLARWTDRRV